MQWLITYLSKTWKFSQTYQYFPIISFYNLYPRQQFQIRILYMLFFFTIPVNVFAQLFYYVCVTTNVKNKKRV